MQNLVTATAIFSGYVVASSLYTGTSTTKPCDNNVIMCSSQVLVCVCKYPLNAAVVLLALMMDSKVYKSTTVNCDKPVQISRAALSV